MPKYKNYLTLILVGRRRHTISMPRQLVNFCLFLFIFMSCASLLVWTTIDTLPAQYHYQASSQNQLWHAKTYLLYQKNYNLTQRNSTLAQGIKMLEAMINSEDEDVIPFNPEYNLVSIEEQNIGWRIFQYKIKIGDRVLYEYIADRYTPKEHQEIKERLDVIQKNIEKLIQNKQFLPEIDILELKDSAFAGYVGDLLVLYVSKQDALQMQTNGLEIAERYKKTLLRELKIAKENKFLQDTPLIGSIRVVNQHTDLAELGHQIEICQKFNADILQKNILSSGKNYNKTMDFKNNYARTPSIVPLQRVEISSPYGYRIHPVTRAASIHYGLDFVAPMNTKILATADGRVAFAGWSGNYGYLVRIYHGMGISTIYGHCAEVSVKTGQYVSKGQQIALSGDSGLTNGPHLHYEVRRWNVAIDPTPYLQRGILAANQNW